MKSPAKEGFAMANTESVSGQRDRSPAYPVVPLEIALTRLTEFETHFKRAPARSEKIGEAWGIKAKAYADRIAAALRYFGLLEYQGAAIAGASRYVIVSDEGRKYLRSQQEETRREVVKAAALRPKQIAKFWTEWGPDRPADAAAIDQLALESGFSDAGARDFLKVYDATIAFAKLSGSDKIAPESEIADDEEERESMQTAQEMGPAAGPSPIVRAAVTGQRQAIFPVSDGDVTMTFPATLSLAGLEELGDYLEVFLKKQWSEQMKPEGEVFKKAVEEYLEKQKKAGDAN
jgi:hypothetical protein